MQMTLLTLPILKKRSILSLVIHLQRWYIARQLFSGKKSGQWQLPEYSYSGLLLQNPIFCSCIFRLKDALAIGLYDENLKTGVEDWEFLLRLLNENSKVVRLNEILFHYRIKKESHHENWKKRADRFDSIRRKIYELHADMLIKYHGDWMQLIDENRQLKNEVTRRKNYVPKRSLKNLLKFLLGRKIYFN